MTAEPSQSLVEVTAERIDDAAGTLLIEQVQQEYERRYGGRDTTPVHPDEFDAPQGHFLVVRLDGLAVACGGVRLVEPALGELKRMYVAPAARGLGLARQLLAALEQAAGELGAKRVRLETGTKQPEALALYASAGYTPIDTFGVHKDEPESRCFGKDLGPAAGENGVRV